MGTFLCACHCVLMFFTMVTVEQVMKPEGHTACTNADIKIVNTSILAKALEHFLQDGTLLMSILALSLALLQNKTNKGGICVLLDPQNLDHIHLLHALLKV